MHIIKKPTQIHAAGNPPKVIEEFIGKVNSNTGEISIARMKSPQGWSEPGQTPDFTEYTVVLKGTLVVETKQGTFEIHENQVVIAGDTEWVKYSTPYEQGAEYIAVCLPAFSPNTVNRDKEP